MYPASRGWAERLEVDCVLFSTTGETPSAASGFAAEVLGHAASNTYWISYAAHAPQSVVVPSGVAAPNGQWKALCTTDGIAATTVADIVIDSGNPARPWRRKARTELYVPHQVANDPRSDTRNLF